MGVELGCSRTQHYERVVQYWANSCETASEELTQNSFPDFVNSMYEIHDFVEIHKAFGGIAPDTLAPIVKKLQKSIGGPLSAAEETSKSNTEREIYSKLQ